ncbi:ATP-binding protein [Candidatus Woesearchaeota archaeon]|nr:MAG: ATP-binding protein [Candidatus Woesearchaeota archaeon]
MLLGRISGKVTTNQFSFVTKPEAEVKKFEYLKVPHRVYNWVLAHVVELETTSEGTTARCQVLGYKDNGVVKPLRIPFDIGTEVFLADDEFITSVVQLETEHGAYLGRLEGKDIPVHLDLNRLLTKHVAVLAKSGSGKSYAVGVLIEEILEHKVPIVIIDPHGEYGTLAEPAENDERMARYGVRPKRYPVREYGDPQWPGLIPLRLPNNLTPQELVHLIPGKLNNTQLGILYNAIKGIDTLDFETLLLQLEQEESSAKWSIINLVEHLRSLGIFSSQPLAYNELVKSGACSIINLRGFAPEIQQVVMYKLAKDLFALRKQSKVPPFFLVIEEAHNFCPERSFGEATSSKILRAIAAEGRKFGLGLCIISQRPARVDKSVLSQCTTQIILKVTNPNDLKAVSNSVEGLTAESEREIQNLPVGTALVTGVTDMPLFLTVRPRRTKHGGQAVNILDQSVLDQSATFLDQQKHFAEHELLPLIKPRTTPKDLVLMADRDVERIDTTLVPAYRFMCEDNGAPFTVLIDMTNGEVVTDIEDYTTARLPAITSLSSVQLKLLQAAHQLKTFTREELVQRAGTSLAIDEELAALVEQEYLATAGGAAGDERYTLTSRYVLSKLSTVACRYPVVFESIAGEQLPAAHQLDDVKASLARFTTVKDQQECRIVRYTVITK